MLQLIAKTKIFYSLIVVLASLGANADTIHVRSCYVKVYPMVEVCNEVINRYRIDRIGYDPVLPMSFLSEEALKYYGYYQQHKQAQVDLKRNARATVKPLRRCVSRYIDYLNSCAINSKDTTGHLVTDSTRYAFTPNGVCPYQIQLEHKKKPTAEQEHTSPTLKTYVNSCNDKHRFYLSKKEIKDLIVLIQTYCEIDENQPCIKDMKLFNKIKNCKATMTPIEVKICQQTLAGKGFLQEFEQSTSGIDYNLVSNLAQITQHYASEINNMSDRLVGLGTLETLSIPGCALCDSAIYMFYDPYKE